MIQAQNLTKAFCSASQPKAHVALNNLSCTIPGGCIYGLVGSNGAGKSTFLRLLSGVYRPDSGTIEIDGLPVWENPAAKNKIFYVPDDLYFLPQNTFSKGMRRQAATILALSTMPDYLFFDETFDGLDPVVRRLVKQVIYNDVLDRGTTTIITSHSLRELEDTCDQLALLHKGGIVFESDIQNLKTALFKVQTAFHTPFTRETFEEAGIRIISYSQMGSVATFIVRGEREATEAILRSMTPLLLDILPLNLEEVFVYEMEALGYAFKDILM